MQCSVDFAPQNDKPKQTLKKKREDIVSGIKKIFLFSKKLNFIKYLKNTFINNFIIEIYITIMTSIGYQIFLRDGTFEEESLWKEFSIPHQ